MKTLALLKPDICASKSLIAEALTIIHANEFKIIKEKTVMWSYHDAELFYADHKGKFFFHRLCDTMSRYKSKSFMMLVVHLKP
jgi:nucleoside-diphosphate kinase